MLKMQSIIRRLNLFQTLISKNSRVKTTHQFYCTNQIVISSSSGDGNSNSSEEEEGLKKKKKKEKETLYSKISPLGNPKVKIGPVLEQWVESGKKVRFAELIRIIHDLRKRNRFTHALEVCEWMKESGLFTFRPTEHAMLLDLIGRNHGYVSAENFFNNLTGENITEKTYGALLHCYSRQRQIDKSLSLLQTMKEKGISLSPVAYNNIMVLYTKVGQHEKVPDVLIQMKENGVSPDNLSYRLCVNSYGVRSEMDGIENVLREMECQPNISMDWNTYAVVANFYIKAGLKDEANSYLQSAEKLLDNKDADAYNHLISLHANLGNKAEVSRLWALHKKTFKNCINKDYLNILKSLVRLDEFESAVECLKEWESSSNCYDFRVPNTIILGYIEKGHCEKAEAILKGLINEGKATTPESWGRLSAGYMYKDEMEKAVECMKVALSVRGQGNGWKPDQCALTRLNKFLGDKGSFEKSEA